MYRAGKGLFAVLVALALWSLSISSSARELAADVDDLVQVEIATLGIAMGGAPVVLLREPDAREVVPIFIGTAEAQAIIRALRGMEMPRPMTHDLFGNVFEGLDVRLRRVFVDDLVDNTFLGMLELEVEGRDEPVRIDSRPSDAMALALRAGATIHVAPKVLEAAADIEYEGLEDEVVTAVGITVSVLTEDVRQALELPEGPGVLVTSVRGEAAEKGMEPGALILEVNGKTPQAPMQFLERVHDTEDERARIRYWQDGEEHDIGISTDVPEPERPAFDPDEGGITL